MKRFIEGEDRRQATLLPDSLEDYVTEDNPVRVVDVFIDELDQEALGFSSVVPEVTGRPAYHPATLLKIYLVRVSQLHPVEPAARTGDPTQHRTDAADRPTDAGLQDDRRLPPRQPAGDPRRRRMSVDIADRLTSTRDAPAQRFRRRFAKTGLVVGCEPAERAEAVRGGDRGDRTAVRSGFHQRATRPIEPQRSQLRHWRRVAEAAKRLL